MSSARSQANHKLYLAKIQFDAWRQALAAQQVAATTLNQAFLPAVREHLRGAYGWFLLAVSGLEDTGSRPPRQCADLPPVPEGKAVPGEIREFRQLEASGWLADLLGDPSVVADTARSAGNLASAVSGVPDTAQAAAWIDQLEALFSRMSDSLDEY